MESFFIFFCAEVGQCPVPRSPAFKWRKNSKAVLVEVVADALICELQASRPTSK